MRKILLNPNKSDFDDLTKFFDYGIQDVITLMQIVNKSNVISDMIGFCQMMNVPLNMRLQYSQNSILTNYICQYAINQNIQFKYKFESNEKIPYQAAYNQKTQGLYLNVIETDINSSYPSQIQQYNISPENFI